MVKVISRRRIMNSRESRFVRFNSTATALLATVLLVSSGAWAKDHKAKVSDDQARVVAHIPFTGLAAIDMVMQNKGSDKYYLYVQHSQDQGISIIDVSKPADSKTVRVIPWPDPTLPGRMNVTGNFAIIAETGVPPMRSSTFNDDLVLWDLSDPVAPRVVQKFSGVVKWLQDDRNFVYVLNGDGLWVISKPADRQPEPAWPSMAGEQ
jgi:hypothetical protein